MNSYIQKKTCLTRGLERPFRCLDVKPVGHGLNQHRPVLRYCQFASLLCGIIHSQNIVTIHPSKDRDINQTQFGISLELILYCRVKNELKLLLSTKKDT